MSLFSTQLLIKTRLHLGGKYSDLTVKCNSREYAVHRAILCSRSGFFDGACSNQFREAQTGLIDLSEEDEEAVEHMIHCKSLNVRMLRSGLHCWQSFPSTPRSAGCCRAGLLFLITQSDGRFRLLPPGLPCFRGRRGASFSCLSSPCARSPPAKTPKA